jgi:hypothetical protein
MISGRKPRKKKKKYAKDLSLSGWEYVAIWRGFKPPHL